jgi:YVTN family beta-propeller protein
VVDVRALTLATEVVVGTGERSESDVALTPDGAFTYVTDSGTDAVYVIETVSNAVVATIPVGRSPQRIAMGPWHCAGDCNYDRGVTVEEIVTGVRVAKGEVPMTGCETLDTDANQQVTVDELVAAVRVALQGCAR